MTTFDPDRLRTTVAELDERISAPGFWDDPRAAGRVTKERARADRRVQLYEGLAAEIEDLPGMLELAAEDDSLVPEIAAAVASASGRIDRLEEEAIFTGEYDGGPAIVSLNVGLGGTDAADWTEMLLRMYLRWAERRGFKAQLLEVSAAEEAGIKSATLTIDGENAYGVLCAERGVHRLVRLSPYDSQHRRQTAFARLDVAPWIDEDVDVEIDEKELRIDTYRASGAGGQHVNKTDSAVRITHLPTGLVVQCQNERSQSSNKQTAMRVLKSRLLELELKRREDELARQRGEVQDNSFGSQIRSYVLYPYTMVKDERTGHKEGNAQAVLDGEIDEFIHGVLLARAAGTARQRGGG